jgi:hypothetical protein
VVRADEPSFFDFVFVEETDALRLAVFCTVTSARFAVRMAVSEADVLSMVRPVSEPALDIRCWPAAGSSWSEDRRLVD